MSKTCLQGARCPGCAIHVKAPAPLAGPLVAQRRAPGGHPLDWTLGRRIPRAVKAREVGTTDNAAPLELAQAAGNTEPPPSAVLGNTDEPDGNTGPPPSRSRHKQKRRGR